MSYRDLKSFQQATTIYDYTAEFCKRYISKLSRTYDQMEQAARSGKQNIAEGAKEQTSKKSELKLYGVARASFEELLEDFRDFLRQRNFRTWNKNDSTTIEVRNLYKLNQADRTDKTNKSNWSDKSNWSNRSYWSYLNSYLENPETAANAAICLIHQVNFLLDRQIKSSENNFIKYGGYTENLRKKREEEKKSDLKKRGLIF